MASALGGLCRLCRMLLPGPAGGARRSFVSFFLFAENEKGGCKKHQPKQLSDQEIICKPHEGDGGWRRRRRSRDSGMEPRSDPTPRSGGMPKY